jgi:hypothetical protein
MLALVRSQVDVSQCALEQHGDSRSHRRGIAGQREHRAVVCGIRLHIEDAKPWNRPKGISHPFDDIEAAPFTDIRNTFDNGHV